MVVLEAVLWVAFAVFVLWTIFNDDSDRGAPGQRSGA